MEKIMDDKTLFALAVECIIAGVLIASWALHIDGAVTTAFVAILGMIPATILGFKFGKNEV